MNRLSLFATLMLVSSCVLAQYGTITSPTSNASPPQATPTAPELPQQPIVNQIREPQRAQMKEIADKLRSCTPGVYGAFNIKGPDNEVCVLKMINRDPIEGMVTHNCRFSKNTIDLVVASLTTLATGGIPFDLELAQALNKECD